MTHNRELLNTITGDYRPAVFRLHSRYFFARRPWFNLDAVGSMLADPRVCFGLEMIKGPVLQNAKFHVKTDDPDIKEFLVNQITRFWQNSAARALRAIAWGFSGHEALYEVVDGLISFDILKDIHPLDTRPVTKHGKFVGMTVKHSRGTEGEGFRKVFVGGPKAFWHVHWRDQHPWFGRSRLMGSFPPWWETWTDDGYRDIRRLYFHKYAFDGGTVYYPPGGTPDSNGIVRSNKDIARDAFEKKKTGGITFLPNTTTDSGNREWEVQDPVISSAPPGLLEYGQELRDEILEGMGVPPEVARAEGAGAFAGRRVPQQAFYAILQELVQWLIMDADTQIFRPIVGLNFGSNHARYSIRAFGLLQEELEANKGEEEIPLGEQPAPPSDASAESQFALEDRVLGKLQQGHAPVFSGKSNNGYPKT